MKEIQDKINGTFIEAFGRTPLQQRLDDIFGEATELCRFTDFVNLKEELGDLLASSLQLANELGVNAEDLINSTLLKIEQRKQQYKSLGRKIKVAIMGGAFDPPTLGHLKVAQYVLNTSRTFDEVWLMPCCNHLYGKKMADSKYRLEMCDLLTKEDKRIKTFDYEIKKEFSGETYQLIKILLEEDFAKNQYDFSLVIGMDNALTFDKWVNYSLLERMIRFVVVPRKGYNINDRPDVNWFLKQPHIYLGTSDSPIPEISSTEIREAIQKGEDISKMTTELVVRYIEEQKLYRS